MEIDDILKRLEERKTLDPDLEDEILRVYGDRGRKAVQAVHERRIKKYRDFFVVVGASGEYVVDDEFCTCRDFLFRKGRCWHVLAIRIAALTGDFEAIDLWYQDAWIPDLPPDKHYLS